MNESNTNSSSKTNWERFDAMADEDIDTSDSPALTKAFFAKAQWLMPGQSTSAATQSASAAKLIASASAPVEEILIVGDSVIVDAEKVTIELEMDSQLLAWFQLQGQDYKQRMQAALRLYAETHQSTSFGS